MAISEEAEVAAWVVTSWEVEEEEWVVWEAVGVACEAEVAWAAAAWEEEVWAAAWVAAAVEAVDPVALGAEVDLGK